MSVNVYGILVEKQCGAYVHGLQNNCGYTELSKNDYYFGHGPLSGFSKHTFSETGSLSLIGCKGGKLLLS
jgi:hypothetical protein